MLRRPWLRAALIIPACVAGLVGGLLLGLLWGLAVDFVTPGRFVPGWQFAVLIGALSGWTGLHAAELMAPGTQRPVVRGFIGATLLVWFAGSAFTAGVHEAPLGIVGCVAAALAVITKTFLRGFTRECGQLFGLLAAAALLLDSIAWIWEAREGQGLIIAFVRGNLAWGLAMGVSSLFVIPIMYFLDSRTSDA